MKLDEFINTYIGKKVDFDGAYGAQCVDLFRQYCKDVLNIPHTGAVQGAKDLFLKYNQMEGEKKFFNALSAWQVRTGDVIVWNGTSSNPYGHVAIVIGVTDENLLVFEQDGYKQDGAKFKMRSFDNVLGVLRLKEIHRGR